jgi:hypothetical protein
MIMRNLDELRFATAARSFRLRVREGEIYYRFAAIGPLAGSHAEVQTSGQVDKRITLTRVAAVGILAPLLKKKVDHRKGYLILAGPGYEQMIPVDPDKIENAIAFASMFNNAAAKAAVATEEQAQ